MAERAAPRWLTRLAESDDTPRRTAAAFAVGVFLSFSPFLGLQILIGVAIAFAMRLSRAAMLIGLCVNLPWIMVPWYALTTAAGAFLLRTPVSADLTQRLTRLVDLPFYRAVFWQTALEIAWPFFWAFVVGSILGAALVGGITYVALVPLLAALRARSARRST